MKVNKLEELRKEIASLDKVIPVIQSQITGEELSDLINKEFIGEYKRLLELIIEIEDLTEEKIRKLIENIVYLKKLASYKSNVKLSGDDSKELNNFRNIISEYIDKIASNNYTIWAPTFNKLFYYSEISSTKFELHEILNFIYRNVNSDKDFTVLDVGAGTGFPSLLIPRIFKNAKVYAFDSSAKMIEIAKELEQIKQWNKNELTLTSIMQNKLDKIKNSVDEPSKINFFISSTVNLVPDTIDLAIMATAIPSYTPYTQELVQSIFRSLKPGGKAMINFSYMSLSRFILLWRDYGWKKARELYRRNTMIDIITEPTEDGKKVFSFKISFSKKVCEQLLTSAGFNIKYRSSIFPLSYLALSFGKRAVKKDETQIRAPYMYFRMPKNIFEKLGIKMFIVLDNFLARWPIFTAYELHFIVEKPKNIK